MQLYISSKYYSNKINLLKNSQKEQNKRRPIINKDACLFFIKKNNNIQNRCASNKTSGSKDFLPNINAPGKTLAQQISDQLLCKYNSHENNQSSIKSFI